MSSSLFSLGSCKVPGESRTRHHYIVLNPPPSDPSTTMSPSIRRQEGTVSGGSTSSLIGQVQVSSVNPIGPQHMTWTSIQTHPTRDLEHTGRESGLTPPGQTARFNNQIHGERCLQSLSHVLPGVLTGNGKMYYSTVTTRL